MIGNITLTIAPNSNLSQIVAHIPILKKEMFSINDRIMVFEFDKNTKWLPNYEFKADEYFGTIVDYEYYPDEKPEDIWSPSHKKQPYNMVWRNLVFLHQSVIVVDRMILQDKYIAVALNLLCKIIAAHFPGIYRIEFHPLKQRIKAFYDLFSVIFIFGTLAFVKFRSGKYAEV